MTVPRYKGNKKYISIQVLEEKNSREQFRQPTFKGIKSYESGSRGKHI